MTGLNEKKTKTGTYHGVRNCDGSLDCFEGQRRSLLDEGNERVNKRIGLRIVFGRLACS